MRCVAAKGAVVAQVTWKEKVHRKELALSRTANDVMEGRCTRLPHAPRTDTIPVRVELVGVGNGVAVVVAHQLLVLVGIALHRTKQKARGRVKQPPRRVCTQVPPLFFAGNLLLPIANRSIIPDSLPCPTIACYPLCLVRHQCRPTPKGTRCTPGECLHKAWAQQVVPQTCLID